MTREIARSLLDNKPSDNRTDPVKTEQEQLPTRRLSENTNSKAHDPSKADAQGSQERPSQVEFRRNRDAAQKWHDEYLRKQLEANHGHRLTKEAIEGIIRSVNKPRERGDKNDLLVRYGDLYDDSYDGFGGEWPDRK